MTTVRGSDLIDLGAEVLPRWLVRAVVVSVLAFVIVTGNMAPIAWYVQDKTAGYIDAMQGFTDEWIEQSQTSIAPSQAPAPAPARRAYE
jgi:hypothetical protein